ncbi:hypothetical protein LXM25_00460 [Dyadobacter sp. LJ53]|uniref:hypothetical protein n=1 Tax=Dyadobacter chenwenxiniae TaxID=2906456 RepID=UPI001F2BB3EE|nr:hypothetical protein [Dyadobacter chenwenxiniae]MCF0048503.1 hypothetical protein [Dyadobacter chenwenxiniae]
MKAGEAGSDEEWRQRVKIETDIAAQGNGFEHGVLHIGEPSHFSCPDCGGAMVQIKEGSLVRFKCHTGHGFSPGTLLNEMQEMTEKKLWQSVRSLEEFIMLFNLTSDNLAQAGNARAAAKFKVKAEAATVSANALRAYIFEHLFKRDSAQQESGA